MEIKGTGKVKLNYTTVEVKVVASVDPADPSLTRGTLTARNDAVRKLMGEWHRNRDRHEILVSTDNETKLKLTGCTLGSLAKRGKGFEFSARNVEWVGWDKKK